MVHDCLCGICCLMRHITCSVSAFRDKHTEHPDWSKVCTYNTCSRTTLCANSKGSVCVQPFQLKINVDSLSTVQVKVGWLMSSLTKGIMWRWLLHYKYVWLIIFTCFEFFQSITNEQTVKTWYAEFLSPLCCPHVIQRSQDATRRYQNGYLHLWLQTYVYQTHIVPQNDLTGMVNTRYTITVIEYRTILLER